MQRSNLTQSPKLELPTVTLVTPSYNAAAYLPAAINSVLTQDYPNIEYLVMDGGSTDDTVEVLRQYGDRLRWVSEKDKGQADAISRGFEQTSGAILGWLNADDALKPGAVSTVVTAFHEHPKAGLIYGNADFIDTNGRIIGPCTVVEPYSRHRLLYYGDYIIQPAAFFTRQAYQSVGGVDSSLHWAMDWDLWIRLALRFEVQYVKAELASYRWLGSNKTAEGGFGRLREVEEVAARYGCKGLPAYFRLEKARQLISQARLDVKKLRWGDVVKNLAKTGATIFSSWPAIKSLANPHIWRNFRTAHALYRQTQKRSSDCP